METTGFEINRFLPTECQRLYRELWVRKSGNISTKNCPLDKTKGICYANAKNELIYSSSKFVILSRMNYCWRKWIIFKYSSKWRKHSKPQQLATDSENYAAYSSRYQNPLWMLTNRIFQNYWKRLIYLSQQQKENLLNS